MQKTIPKKFGSWGWVNEEKLRQMLERVTGKKYRALVDTIDDTHDFAITLQVEYPFMVIVTLDAPSMAKEGDSIAIVVMLTNGINVPGTAWAHIRDIDTGEVVGARRSGVVASMGSVNFSWSNLIMPRKDWNLRIEAGHVE